MHINNLCEAQQLNEELLFSFFQVAEDIRKHKWNYSDELKGRVMATLFYEPSTRTRLSFETAMLRLGGQVISTENAKEFSSAIKGESIQDTIRVVSKYCDCIVMRHYEENASKIATQVTEIPIINAGEGKGQHPTQALLDVYTIYREIGKINGVKIALVGDLLNGRTARSLCYLLGKFKDIEVTFVSPENMKMKDDIKEYFDKHGVKWAEENDLNVVLPRVDVIYMTRIQKERIMPEEYEKAKGKFVINEANLGLIKPESRIMHPLPHVEEIDLPIAVEHTDPRIAYFRESENGLYIRMALLMHLLKNKE